MTQEYVVRPDTDMMAPKWLSERIDYKNVKTIYMIVDGAEKLCGVKIKGKTAKIGDKIIFDGRRLLVERKKQE